MNHLLLLSSALLACVNCVPQADRCGPSEGVVARIIDGDTVELESGEIIRYLMIDTPEIARNSSDVAECFGDEATQANSDLVLGQTVLLDYDTECTDRFGRLLAYVSIGEREINSLLVERGFACVLYIPPNGANRKEEFQALESLAKQEGKGLWGSCESNPC